MPNSVTKNVLVVEDCPIQQKLYEKTLKEFNLWFSKSELESLTLISKNHFDLLIVDVELDPGNGIDLCRSVKKDPATEEIPLLLVSGKSEIGDVLLAFDGGADDYIRKPFHPLELKARIKALLKRSYREESNQFEMEAGPFKLDTKTLKLTIQNENYSASQLVMTAAEFRLFSYFIKNKDVVLSRNQILEGVWGNSNYVTDRTVDAKISNLRKKIEPCGRYLKSIYGYGYKLSTRLD